MFVIYERTSLNTVILVAVSEKRDYLACFAGLRKHTPARDNPYYIMYREDSQGKYFVCAGYGKSHMEAFNELVKKFYDRKSK